MANGSWRLARTRGGAQLPLVIVTVLAITLILLGKAQSALFDNARSYVSDWMEPVLEASFATLDNFYYGLRSFGGIFTVYRDNQRLKEENARLLKWQSTAQILNDRIKRYQKLLHAVPDPALSNVVARVIGRSVHPFRQTLILDAGKANHVKPGEAVVDNRGMIGRIYMAGVRTAWVIPLTDSNSRIPVMIVPGNVQAIMAGDNSRMPVIETLSHSVGLKPGAQVVTSGDGDILPSGLPVGIVVVSGKEYRIALFADQTTAQDVEILDFKRPIEQPSDPAPGDLPVTAAGLAPAPAEPPPGAVPPQAAADKPAPGTNAPATNAGTGTNPKPQANTKPQAGAVGTDDGAE